MGRHDISGRASHKLDSARRLVASLASSLSVITSPLLGCTSAQDPAGEPVVRKQAAPVVHDGADEAVKKTRADGVPPVVDLPASVTINGHERPIAPCGDETVRVRRAGDKHDLCVAAMFGDHGVTASVPFLPDVRIWLKEGGAISGVELLRARKYRQGSIQPGWLGHEGRGHPDIPPAMVIARGHRFPVVPCRSGRPRVSVFFEGAIGGSHCVEGETVEFEGYVATHLALSDTLDHFWVTLARAVTWSDLEFPVGTELRIQPEGIYAAELVAPLTVKGVRVPAKGNLTWEKDHIVLSWLEGDVRVGKHRFNSDTTVTMSLEGRLQSVSFFDKQRVAGMTFPAAGDGIWTVEFGPRGEVTAVDCMRCGDEPEKFMGAMIRRGRIPDTPAGEL